MVTLGDGGLGHGSSLHSRFVGVKAVQEMEGDDPHDSALLRDALARARRYICGFKWCQEVVNEYFGFGVGGVVSVFLFQIKNSASAEDDYIWIVSGDVPTAYLVADEATSPEQALEIYVELMREWIEGVRGERDIRECFPVAATPNEATATNLERRIRYIEKNFLPGPCG
jgi:hypothetical protein